MVGHIGECRHVPRGDVEEMFDAARAVGDAAAGGAMLIDDRDLERLLAKSRQINGGQQSAEAAADDADFLGRDRAIN